MYYNSFKNNNDYYNSYRVKETEQKITKFLLIFLTLSLFTLFSFYIHNYFGPINTLKISSSHNKILIREELPQSIQELQPNIQKLASINEKDIALIVQIIMSKMNKEVKEMQ